MLLGTGTSSSVYNVDNQAHKVFKEFDTYEHEVKVSTILPNHVNVICIQRLLPAQKTMVMPIYSQTLRDLIQQKAYHHKLRDHFWILVTQLFQAVAHVHKHHVLHRDLKPENILLEGTILTLCDWGTAWIPGDQRPFHKVCSPLYCIPSEFPVKTFAQGVQADWWSLGCILVEMKTCRFFQFQHGMQWPRHWSKNFCSLLDILFQKTDYLHHRGKREKDWTQTILHTHPFFQKKNS